MSRPESIASVEITDGPVLLWRCSQWIPIVEEVIRILNPRICEQALDDSRCQVQSLVDDLPTHRELDLLFVGVLVLKIVAIPQFFLHHLTADVAVAIFYALIKLNLSLLP